MEIYYFSPSEFERNSVNWYSRMDKSLLVKIDVLRHMWGAPIRISPHPLAIGRHDGTSQHNIDKWGSVRALDVFFDVPENMADHFRWAVAEEFEYLVKEIGFTGYGIYPNWTLKGIERTGFHLDCRDGDPNNPVTWGRLGNEYVSYEKAFEYLEASE